MAHSSLLLVTTAPTGLNTAATSISACALNSTTSLLPCFTTKLVRTLPLKQSVCCHGQSMPAASPLQASCLLRSRRGHLRKPIGSQHKAMGIQTDSMTHVNLLEKSLEELLEDNEGRITDEALPLIDELEAENEVLDCSTRPDWFNGTFQMLTSSAPGVFVGGTLTLGRLTFGTFKPAGLKLRVDAVLNHVDESKDYYNVETQFTVQDEDGGQPALMGTVKNAGSIKKEGSNTYNIVFLSSTLAPRTGPNQDIKRWLETFGGGHPDMDNDSGIVSVPLPAFPGALTVDYLSSNLRITRGQVGNKFIVKKISQ